MKLYVQENDQRNVPTLVFLHGLGCSGKMWSSHIRAFSDYHYLVPDLPGHGRSNTVEWVSLADTAQQVAKMIQEQAQHRKAHVIGTSLGAAIVLQLLKMIPEVVDRAIVDGFGVLPSPGVELSKLMVWLLLPFIKTDIVIQAVAKGLHLPESLYEQFRQDICAVSPRSFRRAYSQVHELRYFPEIKTVTNPVLFVAGQKEPRDILESNQQLALQMYCAQSRLASNLGHAWLVEAMELHVRMVQAWVNDEPLPQELI